MIQEIKNQISIKHLKNNICFFLSGFCFSLLIFNPARLWLVILAASLIAVGFVSAFFENVVSKFKQSSTISKVLSLIFGLVSNIIFARSFITIWRPSSKVERLASLFHLSNTTLLFVLAGTLALIALFFITLAFDFALTEIKKALMDTVRFSKPKAIISNISKNVMLIISAFALMGLNIKISRSGILSLLLSYVLIVIVFSQVSNISKRIREIPLSIKVYSFISSIGICYYTRSIFIDNISSSLRIMRLFEKINLNPLSFTRWFSAATALLSVAVVFVLVSLLLNYVVSKIKIVFRSLSKAEMILYALLAMALTGFVCFAFLNSNAFWGTNFNYDIIYTSDSPNLVNSNVYLRLYHPENDLRQPLFAVFAAPFVGFGYTLSIPLSYINPAFTPLFMNVIQVLMLVVANLMLAKIINLDTVGRVCFMLFTTVTYTTLLFSVMMEQYIVAYFLSKS